MIRKLAVILFMSALPASAQSFSWTLTGPSISGSGSILVSTSQAPYSAATNNLPTPFYSILSMSGTFNGVSMTLDPVGAGLTGNLFQSAANPVLSNAPWLFAAAGQHYGVIYDAPISAADTARTLLHNLGPNTFTQVNLVVTPTVQQQLQSRANTHVRDLAIGISVPAAVGTALLVRRWIINRREHRHAEPAGREAL